MQTGVTIHPVAYIRLSLKNKSMNTKSVIVYHSKNRTSGLFSVMGMFFSDLRNARFVIWFLFKRDFIAQFRQKLFGYFWIVIAPFMAVLPFIFLTKVGIFRPGATDMPYPIFIVIGLGIWSLMTSCFSTVSNCLQFNDDLIKRTNIPKITFAITGLANVLYNLIVHFVVVVVFVMIMGKSPSIWLCMYPLALIPIILFSFGLGLLFSVIGTIARDLGNIVLSILNLLLFISPVVYMPNFNHPLLTFVITWNPFTYLVDFPRAMLVLGEFRVGYGFLFSSVFSIAFVFIGIHSFYLIKDKVAEQL